jgi:hypothetical protein
LFIESALTIATSWLYLGLAMSEQERDTMKQVLEGLEHLRAEAGNLMADRNGLEISGKQVGAVTDYLAEQVMSWTMRLGRLGEVTEQLAFLRKQVEQEIGEASMKRIAFVQALDQLDAERSREVKRKAREMEKGFEDRARGEYADMPVWEAARIILQRAGRDLTTKEIVDELRKGGKKLGPKPTSSVSAALRQGKAGEVFEPRKVSGSRLRWALRQPEGNLFNEGEDTES